MNNIKYTEMATRFIAIDLFFTFHKIPFGNFAFVYLFVASSFADDFDFVCHLNSVFVS